MLRLHARALAVVGAFVFATLGSACVVTVPTYDECGDSSDCSSGADSCIRVITTDSLGRTRDGNQCSRFCDSDADCPGMNGYAGACYAIADDPVARNLTCYARCDLAYGDADCDQNQNCVEVTFGAYSDMICLPAF
jgi:hypothetical protein